MSNSEASLCKFLYKLARTGAVFYSVQEKTCERLVQVDLYKLLAQMMFIEAQSYKERMLVYVAHSSTFQD